MDKEYYPQATNLSPEAYDIFNMVRERIRRDTVLPFEKRDYGAPKSYFTSPEAPRIGPPALPLTKYGNFSKVDDWTPDAIQQFELRLRLNAQKYNQTRRSWEIKYSAHWLFKKMFNDRPFFTYQ